jgi:hypothetical protein
MGTHGFTGRGGGGAGGGGRPERKRPIIKMTSFRTKEEEETIIRLKEVLHEDV